jgi:hypothetical protein
MAKMGYGVDKLVNDPDPRVRVEVAKGGYFTQELLKDESPEVRAAVKKYLGEE